ncbi:MAG: EhaD family protein [Methanomicrobiales archaeon]|nr:EhaD family protein [Methanomicrobiales archaeon]
MDQIMFLLCALIILIGSLLTWYWYSHYEKLIGVGVITGGIMPPLISTGYLDVAIIIALVSPFAALLLTLLIREGKAEAELQEEV